MFNKPSHQFNQLAAICMMCLIAACMPVHTDALLLTSIDSHLRNILQAFQNSVHQTKRKECEFNTTESKIKTCVNVRMCGIHASAQ